MSAETIIFEQPVNEQIRACLRLEHLFQKALNNLRGSSIWDSRMALSAIIDILNILDRPDLKNKLAKELGRHLATLSRLEETPAIDQQKLTSILIELEDYVDLLNATSGKIGQELRENDFLNHIRQYLPTPGGTCGFDTPAYHLWLQQPAAERISNLAHWLRSLETIYAAIEVLLRLIRQSSSGQAKVAANGYFQAALDPQAPCQLVRVSLAAKLKIYPEISVSRHGISIRFLPLSIDQRFSQLTQDVQFNLTTCIF